MRAVVAEAGALHDADLPDPVPGPRDLLVEVRAVAVNPLDTRMRAGPERRVLGWDAAGLVRAAGAEARLFRPGDAVFYAGSVTRPGCDSDLHLVDERLAGPMPAGLAFSQAAGLAAAGITAWEMLVERMRLADADSLLIIGGAGGVGSMAIQLARALTGARVIATASRPESRDWCLGLGAHAVIDHAGDIPAQLKALGTGRPNRIFCTTASDAHWKAMLAVAAPMGAIGLIDDGAPLDARALRPKGLSLHYVAMFARPIFSLPDMDMHHAILGRIAGLAEAGRLRPMAGTVLAPMNAATLGRAHALVESGRTIGKVVVAHAEP